MADRDELARALAYERAGYARSSRPDRVIAVDEELAKIGYCVDAAGALHEVDTDVTAPKTLSTADVEAAGAGTEPAGEDGEPEQERSADDTAGEDGEPEQRRSAEDAAEARAADDAGAEPKRRGRRTKRTADPSEPGKVTG